MDLLGTVAVSLCRVAVVDLGLTIRYTNRPDATTASAIVTATIFRPVPRAIDLLGSISDSSLIPSGVISNAQENASAIGNPTTRIRMATCIAHCGALNAGRKIDAA